MLSALAAAEAELAAIGPDAAKNKVLYLHTVQRSPTSARPCISNRSLHCYRADVVPVAILSSNGCQLDVLKHACRCNDYLMKL